MNTKNLKPFNLEAALNGEPVMLRDGSKAFVRHYESELLVENGWQLIGFIVRNGEESVFESWDARGRFYGSEQDDENDIIGMWPLGTTYFVPVLTYCHLTNDYRWDGKTKAMLGINPYEVAEE